MNEKLPKGIRKQGNIYEGRACIKGHKISVRGKDLEDVIVRFQKEKLKKVKKCGILICLSYLKMRRKAYNENRRTCRLAGIFAVGIVYRSLLFYQGTPFQRQ